MGTPILNIWDEEQQKYVSVPAIQGAPGQDAPPQVQSDWNQNDSTAKDYVKNRTHYVEKGFKSVTLTEENHYSESFKDGIPFSAGDTVLVIVDGTSLSLVAQEVTLEGRDAPLAYVGKNPLESDDGNNSPYDWCYVCAGSDFFRCFGLSAHTIQVPTLIYHPLPLQYSPLTITSNANLDTGSALAGFVQISKLIVDNAITTEDNISVQIHLDPAGNILKLSGDVHKPDRFPYRNFFSSIRWSCFTELNVARTATIPLEDVDASVKDYLGTYGSGCRLLANALFKVNDAEYSSLLELSDNALTGTFVTQEGYLYTVVISFNTTTANNRFNQDWTLRVTRIF